MKKFLMYCLVLVVVLFLGFTTYYFVQNKENITLAHDQADALKLNEGETFGYADLITHTDPHKSTTIKISIGDESILSYDKDTKTFTAAKAGATTLTIKPSNSRFGPFTLNVKVGNGQTTDLPYFISDASELTKIGQAGSGWTNGLNYELIADIYLTDLAFTPIAYNSEFTGTFNGGGHTVYDLKISDTYITTAGLFAEVGKNGIVKNLHISNAKLTGEFVSAGVIAGINKGIICLSSVSNSTIENARGDAYLGGIAGQNQANIFNTSIKGANIGMCAVESTSITTTAGAVAGGIVGKNNASTVEDCFVNLAEFKSSADSTFGGIAGQNLVVTSGSISLASSIMRTHASVENITNSGSFAGIAGSANDSASGVKNTYTSNYYNIDTLNMVGNAKNFAENQIAKKSSDELKAQTTYAGWDFENTWKMGEKYAVIDFENAYSASINQGDIDTEGDNIIDNPNDNNQVGTSENEIYQMVADMRANPNAGKAYAVTGTHTINLSIAPWNSSAWEPIGTAAKPFNGKLIVSGSLTFTNLVVEDKTYAGFFGYVSGATISNVDFVNVTIDNDGVSATNAYAGAIAGYAGTGTRIVGCDVSGLEISAHDKLGGIVGANLGTIQKCNIKSTNDNILTALDASCNVGGIAGQNSGSIISCEAAGLEVRFGQTASGYAGGIVGTNDGVLSSVTASDVVISTTNTSILRLGGVAGQNNKNMNSVVAENVQLSASTASPNIFVAGVAAINGTSAKITGAKVAASLISGYNAGGVSVDNFGTISRAAVGVEGSGEGKISGRYVGGLAVNNNKDAKISDSMVCAVLEGIDTFGNVNGWVYKLREGAVIENCLAAASFVGKGGFNADTATEYRNWWAGIWQHMPWNDKMGTIKNSLVVNVSGKAVQGYGALIDLVDNPVLSKYDIVISPEKARGSDNFSAFNKAGFSTSSWTFVAGKLPVPKV